MAQFKVRTRATSRLYLAIMLGFFVVFLFSAIFSTPISHASGTSMFFSPASGSYKVGQTFSVGVYVSSTSQSMNAASGTISFSSDVLSATSVSKSGSIISLWTKDPTYSNSSGTIDFEGIVLNPGYQGSSGKLITISFRVQNAGTASLNFASGSILANDGQGTEIISGFGAGFYQVSGQTDNTASAPAPTQVNGLPAAPKVNSATHPDPNFWYANANPSFSWTLPRGVTLVNFFGDQNPSTDPNSSAP